MLIWTNFHSCANVEKDKNIKTCTRMGKRVTTLNSESNKLMFVFLSGILQQ